MGLFNFYRKKHFEAAQKLYFEAKASYEYALEADTVLDFLAFWHVLQERNASISEYEDKVSPQDFILFSSMRRKETEFQWRLRDAIERSKIATITDLHGEHRNNKIARCSDFVDDLNYAADESSEETASFAAAALYEVSRIAGVNLSSPNTAQEDISTLDIDFMDGHQFELWCSELLTGIGYSDVRLTGKSGDQGVDLLAAKDGIRYAIQCKCYSSDLGNAPVQEVNTGKVIYRCHVGAVMTNRRFTEGGKAAAEATGVLLWDRDWIERAVSSIRVSQNTAAEQARPVDKPASSSADLFASAVDVVMETNQASVSILQRRLKLGYAHAARLIDEMEAQGIVGPFRGSKPRAIMISKKQWDSMKTTL